MYPESENKFIKPKVGEDYSNHSVCLPVCVLPLYLREYKFS